MQNTKKYLVATNMSVSPRVNRSILKSRQSIVGFQSNDANVLDENPFEVNYYNTFKNKKKRVRWEKRVKHNLHSTDIISKISNEPYLQVSQPDTTTFDECSNQNFEHTTIFDESPNLVVEDTNITLIDEFEENTKNLTSLLHNESNNTTTKQTHTNFKYRIVQVVARNKKTTRKKRKKIDGYKKKKQQRNVCFINYKTLKKPIFTQTVDFLTLL